MEKILLNPKNIVAKYADDETKQIMLKTIDFFEGRGLKKMKDDFHACKWYTEFLDFMKENQIMAKLLTPAVRQNSERNRNERQELEYPRRPPELP